MSGRGRPAIGPKIATRFPQDVVEEIDEIAETAEEPRAEVIRELVNEALAQRHEEQGK